MLGDKILGVEWIMPEVEEKVVKEKIKTQCTDRGETKASNKTEVVCI